MIRKITLGFMALLILSTTQPLVAQNIPGAFGDPTEADLNAVFGGNWWTPFGEGVETCAAGFAGLVTEDSSGIWSYFLAAGFTEEQTAGIMGNLRAESNLMVGAVNPSSGATGIAQWLGGRLTRLYDYANARGTDWEQLDIQLDYIMFELTGESPTPEIAEQVSGITGGSENGAYNHLREQTTVDNAAASFAMRFERYQSANEYRQAGGTVPPGPGDEAAFQSAFNGREGTRIDFARQFYAENGGTFTSSALCAGAGAGGPSEIIAGDTTEIQCGAGEDLGEAEGWANGQRFQIRICRVQGTVVNSQISASVNGLYNAALGSGIDMNGWGFRTMSEQENLRVRNCSAISSLSDPDLYTYPSGDCETPTARPGYSNHQMGLAIDFYSPGVVPLSAAGFNWLVNNAASFGLFNFPRERWHWSVDGR